MKVDTQGVRLGVLSDLHATPDSGRQLSWHNPFDFAGTLPRLRAGLAWLAWQEVDAILVLGDLSNDGDPESLDAALETLAEHCTCPTLVVPGNHDAEQRPDALALARERAGPVGIELAGAAGVDIGGLRIAALEGAEAAPADGPLVLLSHWPLISRADAFAAAGLAYAGDLEGGKSVLAALEVARSAAPTLILTGHLHARDSVQAGSLLQMTVGALVEPPYEVSVITVRADRAGLRIERHAHELPGPAPAGPAPALVPAHETLTLRVGA